MDELGAAVVESSKVSFQPLVRTLISTRPAAPFGLRTSATALGLVKPSDFRRLWNENTIA